MITKFIGMKTLRENLAKITKEAQQKNTCFIVLKKNIPVLEIKPIDEKKFAYEKLKAEIEAAREQIKRGEFYTQEEIMKEFGLL